MMRLLPLLACGAASVAPGARDGVCEAEMPHLRTYFYVGGQYGRDTDGAHRMRGQMYVERLLPIDGVTQEWPVVLVHGKGMTGTNFLNTPDGRRGWASDFLSQGYEVYLVDQALRGRSPWLPPGDANGTEQWPLPSAFSAELIQDRFTATRINKLWPQAGAHTQWPGMGIRGDPVFDAFYASTVQSVADAALTQRAVQRAGAALLDRIGRPAILVGHSQGGTLPTLIADARPALSRALVLLEPAGPPFREAVFDHRPARAWGLTDSPLTYRPAVRDPARDIVQATRPALSKDHTDCILQADEPAPRRLVNLARKPILVLTAESSYHARYDHCTVEYLRQAGCSRTQHVELAKLGIRGNGHMMFLERNSRHIQGVVHQWIQEL
ncbi:hypothetical protein CDD83_901 [Cordyceps sp. RAO-2017]|nr:hypothetical protein CDD83_901 [Cordyceps sp. RAO-2017]